MKTPFIFFLIIISSLFVTSLSNAQVIQGTVNSDGTPVDNGIIIMYHTGPHTLVWPIHDSIEIGQDGTYKFENVPDGDWLLYTIADTIGFMPTYSPGSHHRWDSVNYVRVSGDTQVVNVELIKRANLTWNGAGYCNGTIYYDGGKTEGDPIPDVDIVLEQIPGGVVKAQKETDTKGFYQIGDINDGSHYQVFLRIPGLDMDTTFEVLVTQSNRAFEGLDLCVDTTTGSAKIFICSTTGINDKERVIQSQVRLFPNPASTSVGIAYIDRFNQPNDFNVRLLDISGKTLDSYSDHRLNTFDVSAYPSGVYIVEVSKGQSVVRERLVLSR